MGVLEIILIILGSIVLLLLILLIIPLGIKIDYSARTGKTTLFAKIWFVTVKLDLDKEKKVKKKKQKKEEPEEKAEAPSEKKSKFQNALDMYKKHQNLIKLVPATLYRIIERIRIYDIEILWYIHKEDDAAATAIATGQMYAAFFAATSVLSPPFKFEYKSVDFLPDFVGNAKYSSRATVKITTNIASLAAVAIWFYGQIKK